MTDIFAFDRAFAITLGQEGGLVDDPNDPGGITNHGISIRFAGSIGLDVDNDGQTTGADIRALTTEQAKQIYRDHFWNPLQCEFFHFSIALAVFDTGVNQGVRTSAKLLQRAADAVVDGNVGPNTIRAVNFAISTRPVDFLDDLTARRAKRYAQTRNVDRYGRGWYRRLLKIYAIGLDELA